jgi:hypothetical protein
VACLRAFLFPPCLRTLACSQAGHTRVARGSASSARDSPEQQYDEPRLQVNDSPVQRASHHIT